MGSHSKSRVLSGFKSSFEQLPGSSYFKVLFKLVLRMLQSCFKILKVMSLVIGARSASLISRKFLLFQDYIQSYFEDVKSLTSGTQKYFKSDAAGKSNPERPDRISLRLVSSKQRHHVLHENHVTYILVSISLQ